ncbi:hypothetical protein [Hydrogenophaga sp. PBL-H3]|uniref:hypothetical protein n=1 Tax=Hydrogenophaga sp. PBL-H3 TaxID=434010 RepID=UPI001320209D|nr:hypothetical protein [Hydrogenophaga sp. PBL-H3]QHE77482.1 hypothetical protein F9Z45_16300 [Hydrogenophaga sp. PBL-H3]QHE81906.1 hypothetical protein F9Z44_16300 [Hydrogenophaga sp. PBL-H3]
MNTTRHEDRSVTERLCRAIRGRRSSAMKAAAAVLIVAGVAGWSAPTSAQSTTGAEWPLEEIEKAFWACDYAASTRLVEMGSAIACSRLTEALRQLKFDGDFNAMLNWWQQHKEAEHRALAKAGGASLPRSAPSAR